MLAAGRRRTQTLGVDNVGFIEGDAQVDRPDSAPFDVAFSRFGVMFFADPVAAFTNIAGWLVPGGRLGFVCFQSPSANPFITGPVMAAAAVLGFPPPDPSEPSPFSLADADRTLGLLNAAGFTDVTFHEGPTEAVLTTDEDSPVLAERLIEQHPVAGIALAAASPENRVRAVAATAAVLEDHRTGNEVRLGASIWVVGARRSD
jgi:SAM-dependent methyltransferase